jgi:hypothetical protein
VNHTLTEWYCIKSVGFLIIFIVVTLAWSAGFSDDRNGEGDVKISQRSAVSFNILCAKCHEGQCSGRLSFSDGTSVTRSHIQRYAGSTDEKIVSQLYAILSYIRVLKQSLNTE